MEVTIQNPLKWSEGWDRTRLSDRQAHGVWKRTVKDYTAKLVKELGKLGATEIVISYNLPPTDRMDCGVAVYWSKEKQEDYGWQDALGLQTPCPTLEEIDKAARGLASKVHPDGPTPDRAVFDQIMKHRENARNWVNGNQGREHEFSIPCDKFNEVRLNIAAIYFALVAFRRLEMVGIPAILERTFRGLRTALPAHVAEKGE